MEHRSRFAKPNATYQDVIDAPEGMIAEIIGGALYLQPRPASPHGAAADLLLADLLNPFQRGKGGPGGWWIKAEPEIHFQGEYQNTFVPDLAGWRRETLPVYPVAPYMTVTPDWVCEVISPSTAKIDRSTKGDFYAAAGIGHFWIVDPLARTLEAFALADGNRWLRLGAWGDAAQVAIAPFEAVELSLGDFWLGD